MQLQAEHQFLGEATQLLGEHIKTGLTQSTQTTRGGRGIDAIVAIAITTNPVAEAQSWPGLRVIEIARIPAGPDPGSSQAPIGSGQGVWYWSG